MMELIIEPAKFLIDALNEKTALQLIDLINLSSGCERLASIAIHLTAIDTLMQKYPREYEIYFMPNQKMEIS